jgi:hypothetical protein
MNTEFKNIIELVKDQEKKLLFIHLFEKGNNLQKARLLERIEKIITIKN